MFNKQDEDRPVTATPPRQSAIGARGSAVASVIGPTLSFVGELSAEEDLIIEGRIEGVIKHQKKNLTVGGQGRVKADIHAKIVVIEGKVEGDVRGDELVVLTRGASVVGNISTPRLSMEEGARFKGNMDIGGDEPERSASSTRTGT